MIAPKGKVLIEWKRPDDWGDIGSGVYAPSDTERRDMMRKAKSKILIPGEIPDVLRWGTLLDGECGAPIGSQVLFNKHDGELIELNKQLIYSIPATLVLGYQHLTENLQ